MSTGPVNRATPGRSGPRVGTSRAGPRRTHRRHRREGAGRAGPAARWSPGRRPSGRRSRRVRRRWARSPRCADQVAGQHVALVGDHLRGDAHRQAEGGLVAAPVDPRKSSLPSNNEAPTCDVDCGVRARRRSRMARWHRRGQVAGARCAGCTRRHRSGTARHRTRVAAVDETAFRTRWSHSYGESVRPRAGQCAREPRRRPAGFPQVVLAELGDDADQRSDSA